MKRLKSQQPNRQQIWTHDGKRYSIVDLRIIPFEKKMPQSIIDSYRNIATSTYGEYCYEVADITEGNVAIVGRFTSFQEARDYIRGKQRRDSR